MGLTVLTDGGHFEWECRNGCGYQQAHVSHEQVEWVGHPGMPAQHHLVALPPCPDCGSRMFLKAHFTEAELLAPNMWLPWSGELEERLQLLQRLHIMSTLPEEFVKAGYNKQTLGEEIAALAKIKAAGGMTTPSRAMAERHMSLVGHMEKHGKGIPPQE